MFSLTDLIVGVIGLVILWVIASVPAYFAGKIVTGGKATFGEAMGATLGGAIVFFLVLILVTFFLSAVISTPVASAFALLLGFLSWLAVYRAAFDTGWLGAFGIAVLSLIIAVIIVAILAAVTGVSAFSFFHLHM